MFSAFSFVAFFVYMYIGLYAYKHNKKSIVNRVFLLLCTSYAIWSFAYAFAYISDDHYVFSIWNKISALGWCSFSANVAGIFDEQVLMNILGAPDVKPYVGQNAAARFDYPGLGVIETFGMSPGYSKYNAYGICN